MKGKGKGKDIVTKGKNTNRDKDKEKEKDSDSDTSDCSLQLPDLPVIDCATDCPKYSSVAQRSDEDGNIHMEDVDPLQLELECLLSNVIIRQRILDSEAQVLKNWQDKKDIVKNPPSLGKQQPWVSPGKRSGKVEEKPGKKLKLNSSPVKIGYKGPGRPPKHKKPTLPPKLQPEVELPELVPEIPKVPKNDAPNRFWASLEPYCTEITPDDIKLLEELVKTHDEDADYFQIPPAGKHYSAKWASEDFEDEQRESAKITPDKTGNKKVPERSENKFNKKLDKSPDNGDNYQFGSLTQRLISSLIDENIMTGEEDFGTTNGRDERKESGKEDRHYPLTRSSFLKGLNVSNAMQLEKRIKKELEEQGLIDLDAAVFDNTDSDDEVYHELKRCQNELKALTAHNMAAKRRLLKLAQEELARQELRKKLQLADNEVIESHRKIIAARQKKRPLSKKEKDVFWKVLKDRDAISKQLEAI